MFKFFKSLNWNIFFSIVIIGALALIGIKTVSVSPFIAFFIFVILFAFIFTLINKF